MSEQKTAFDAWYATHDPRTPQSPFDRALARKAWDAALQSLECCQCVPLSTDGKSVFIDGVGDVPLDFSGQASGDLISKYQEKVRALEADNHALVAETDELKRRGEPVGWEYLYSGDWIRTTEPDVHVEKGRKVRALYASPQPAEPVNDGQVGEMTPNRAAFFLERFKRDEKMLGPNEQRALDYAIEVLEAEPVKVPSEELTEFMSQFADGFDIPPYRFAEAACALLARYVQPADPIAQDGIHATQPPQIPEGYKLVPIEPADEMLGAGLRHVNGMASMPSAYKAMLEAAPEVKP